MPAGSADFANIYRFVRLLVGGSSTTAPSPETLFDRATMAKPEKTLLRAALLIAGRLPTRAELGAVSDSRNSTLRRAIRNLMKGRGIHKSLIRASNDRLLTDRHLDARIFNVQGQQFFVELANTQLALAWAAIGRGCQMFWRDPVCQAWYVGLRHGLARAPLELIADVVERDRSHTEILTADYIMANLSKVSVEIIDGRLRGSGSPTPATSPRTIPLRRSSIPSCSSAAIRPLPPTGIVRDPAGPTTIS